MILLHWSYYAGLGQQQKQKRVQVDSLRQNIEVYIYKIYSYTLLWYCKKSFWYYCFLKTCKSSVLRCWVKELIEDYGLLNLASHMLFFKFYSCDYSLGWGYMKHLKANSEIMMRLLSIQIIVDKIKMFYLKVDNINFNRLRFK